MTPEEKTQLKELLKKAIVQSQENRETYGQLGAYGKEWQNKANITFFALAIEAIKDL